MKKFFVFLWLFVSSIAHANFVTDLDSLPPTKSNLHAPPAGYNSTKYFLAADYNAISQALYDIRAALLSLTALDTFLLQDVYDAGVFTLQLASLKPLAVTPLADMRLSGSPGSHGVAQTIVPVLKLNQFVAASSASPTVPNAISFVSSANSSQPVTTSLVGSSMSGPHAVMLMTANVDSAQATNKHYPFFVFTSDFSGSATGSRIYGYTDDGSSANDLGFVAFTNQHGLDLVSRANGGGRALTVGTSDDSGVLKVYDLAGSSYGIGTLEPYSDNTGDLGRDGTRYRIARLGTRVESPAYTTTSTAIAQSSATATLDASLGSDFAVTLTANVTSWNVTNCRVGQHVVVTWIQGAGQPWTLAGANAAIKFLPTLYLGATHTAPTLTITAAARDTEMFYCDNSSNIIEIARNFNN